MAQAILLGVLAGLAFALGLVAMKIPRHDREWQPHLAVTPEAVSAGLFWTVSPVRDWRYSADAPVSTDWQASVQVDVDRLEEVYLVVEPHPGLPLMAHTLVLFRFDTGQLLGLTIEARKEMHEEYSPIRGALNRFELIYAWATPQDLLTRRAVMLKREIEIYPLALTPDQRTAFLQSVLTRTASIHERPRFYNTFWSNCTNELAKSASLAWDPAFILTGNAARALHRRGIIPGDDYDSVRAKARQTDWLRANASLPEAEFDAGLIEMLNAELSSPRN